MAEHLTERRRSIRRKAQHPARILYKTPLLVSEQSLSEPPGATLLCLTRDLSETGMALVVPCLRDSDYNFFGIECELQVMFSTPEGLFEKAGEAVSYKWLDPADKSKGFLIGVRTSDESIRPK